MSENYQKTYYEKNKEAITAKKRECRAAKREHYAAVSKRRYDLKRDHILEQGAARRKRDPETMLTNLARARAKSKGLDFTITRDDIQIPECCPLLGMPLERGVGKVGPASPSLDRIFPSLGYIPSNVWVISFRANAIKNAASIEELILLTTNLERKLNK
jgi:hypothetical protein